MDADLDALFALFAVSFAVLGRIVQRQELQYGHQKFGLMVKDVDDESFEFSPVPENSLDGQTLPEIDPFIEYGRATQEEEDPDAGNH
ncbi:hypothetical protein V8E54_008400 [Elaphomyces granulatus]